MSRWIGDDEIVESGVGEPESLGQREAEGSSETVSVERPLLQMPAPNGLARNANGFPAGPTKKVRSIGIERVEVHDGKGRIDIGSCASQPIEISMGG